MVSYVIATVPRSGSYLLCEALSSTGVAGFPQEYATVDDTYLWRDFFRFRSHVEYVIRLPQLCRTTNRIAGLKLMPWQLTALKSDLERYFGLRMEQKTDPLEHWLGDLSYIRLVRRDIVRSAISLVRALKTNSWIRKTNETKETPELLFDKTEIDHAIAWLSQQQSAWDVYFSTHSCRVLTLTYEDLCQNQRSTINQILDWLDIKTSSPVPINVTLKKQADDLTDQWIDLYCASQ